jgi:hypothetical protein
MISRVIAEFEAPEMAETALRRIKESVEYVYSGNIMYPRSVVRKHFLSRGTNYAVVPNSFTSSVADSETELSRPSSGRQKNTTACVICGSGAVENVMAVLNAMGGLNIHSAV